jgi:general stress protein 26
MEKEEAIKKSLELIKRSKIVLLGTNSEDGYPNIKALLNLETEGLKTIWLSTNTSSKRVRQIKENPKACVYYVDESQFVGLMLLGKIEILNDRQSRKKLWRDGYEKYYRAGIDDPDYSVLRVTSERANFYYGLSNVSFEV